MLGVSKRYISRAIAELSIHNQFAVIFGNETGTQKYPENGKPAKASNNNKSGATSFLEKATVSGLAPIREDFKAALQIAGSMPVKRKIILYVGAADAALLGEGPNSLLKQITIQNTQKIPIHTIGISPYPESEEFLKKVSALSGGKYKKVDL